METAVKISPLEYQKATKLSSLLSTLFRKNPKNDGWIPATPKQTLKSLIPKPIRIATLNIWFDATLSTERWQQSLLNLCELKPDVICLQETTKKFLIQMSEQPWIQQDYFVSDINGATFVDGSWYGCAIAINKNLGTLPIIRMLKFPGSKMGRGLLTVDLSLVTSTNEQKTISIGTSHLESRKEDWPERQEQLKLVAKLLQTNSIFCGDLNIYDDKEESTFISNLQWKDSYSASNITQGSGETWGKWHVDPKHNGELRRLDRILLRDGIKVLKYEMFGDLKLQGLGIDVYPSDHLGVCVDVEVL